jgi:hypothetical protein
MAGITIRELALSPCIPALVSLVVLLPFVTPRQVDLANRYRSWSTWRGLSGAPRESRRKGPKRCRCKIVPGVCEPLIESLQAAFENSAALFPVASLC